jgi:hypothetical protein
MRVRTIVLACVGSEEHVWDTVELTYQLAATRENNLVGGGKKRGFLSPGNLLLCCMAVCVLFVLNMHIGRKVIEMKVSNI